MTQLGKILALTSCTMSGLKFFRSKKSVQLAFGTLFLSALGLQSQTVALASYHEKEHKPVHEEHWSERQVFDERGILQSQFVSSTNLFKPEVADSTIIDVLNDSEHKVSKEFEIPTEMRESVKFWLKIYTQWSTRQVVLFDSNHMDTIYEVIDLKALAAKSRNQVVYEILSERLIKKTVEKYRHAFQALAKNPKPLHPTHEEKVILAASKHLPHHHSFKELQASMKVMRGQRDQIISGLVAGENYLPKMEKVFAEMNVPVEITRLALVESSFNIKAGSRVGARGMWQIMPATGKSFLTIDETKKIDERISPIKSTIAAAKLLKWNYKYLGSWILSIISYNHGHSGMPRFRDGGFEFSKVAYLFEPCSKKKHLGFASRNYYSEFLAVVHAVAYQTRVYGEAPEPTLKTLTFHRVETSKSAFDVASERGMSVEEFKIYNPDVQDMSQTLKKGFWIASSGDHDNLDELLTRTVRGHKAAKKSAPHKVVHKHVAKQAHKQAHKHSHKDTKPVAKHLAKHGKLHANAHKKAKDRTA
jgi:hypothetical protein